MFLVPDGIDEYEYYVFAIDKSNEIDFEGMRIDLDSAYWLEPYEPEPKVATAERG